MLSPPLCCIFTRRRSLKRADRPDGDGGSSTTLADLSPAMTWQGKIIHVRSVCCVLWRPVTFGHDAGEIILPYASLRRTSSKRFARDLNGGSGEAFRCSTADAMVWSGTSRWRWPARRQGRRTILLRWYPNEADVFEPGF